jgi:hypothetical protein
MVSLLLGMEEFRVRFPASAQRLTGSTPAPDTRGYQDSLRREALGFEKTWFYAKIASACSSTRDLLSPDSANQKKEILMENIMYTPEAYGFEYVCEVELSEPCYSFDCLRVLKNKDGYWLGTDSGCSCPTPFEDYHDENDLTGPLTAEQVHEEANSLWDGEYDAEGFSSEMAKVV